jgi:hypothetical protein
MADFNTSKVISGLRTTGVPYLEAGPCQLVGKLTLPRASQGSTSASTVVVTVNQNGTPIYTGRPGADGFECGVNIALNDVIQVVTSSSNPLDQALNAVKMTLSIYEGGE